MTNIAKALHKFWNGFALTAYEESSVPDDAELPYITFSVSEPDTLDSGPVYARVWYNSTSWAGINAKVDEISATIGEGIKIPTATGLIALYKGQPFAQPQPIEKTDLKVQYINLQLTNLTR